MKILIISHNPITTYQNMGKTLLAMFSAFQKEELCQLYIYPTVPDIDVCNSYYRVTDRDIFKSYFHFGNVHSKVLKKEDIDPNNHSFYESDEDAIFYKKRKKNAIRLIIRDLMWCFSKWYNKDLKQWLKEEKPTCIFLAPGESKFIYNIALKIAHKLDIGIVTYICDEFYFVNTPEHIVERIQLNLLRRKMRKTLSNSKSIITICNELENLYHNEFDVDAYTMFTGSSYPIASKPIRREVIKGFTFMGNLSHNRFESIADIGRVLDEINIENNANYKLFIYSNPIKDSVRDIFLEIKSIEYCGYVTGKEFEKTIEKADVLLHVEAFDTQSKERVKHSISTKIADSLGSGHLLFAYGPKEIASMQHLIKNECAITVTSFERLKSTLYETIFEQNQDEVINKALKTAQKYHISENNSMRLYHIIRKVSQ